MLPLFAAAAHAVGHVFHGITDAITGHKSQAHAAASTDPSSPDFASTMASLQQNPAVAAAIVNQQQTALTGQLMSTPEVTGALGKVDPSKPVQLEMTSSGSMALRTASGKLENLSLNANTKALVSQLYSLHNPKMTPGKVPPTAVLAVDPTQTSTAVFSALPAR